MVYTETLLTEIVRLRSRVAELEHELEAYNQVLLESQGQFRADLQAARVEGLREGLGRLKQAFSREAAINDIAAEIAALERGKEKD